MDSIEELVWGETRGITPSDDSDATLTRLYAVVARMALTARERGLDGHLKSSPLIYSRSSKTERDRYNLMLAALEQVLANAWTGTPLPQRAALWELNADGKLRIEGDKPPPYLAWITESTTRSGGDFKSADGRMFRLLESDQVSQTNELPFASAYTGTSLPVPEARTRAQRAWPWFIGLVGGIGFIVVALNVSHTSNSFAQAYDLLTGRQPAHVAAFARGLVLPPCTATLTDMCDNEKISLQTNGTPKKDAELAATLAEREAFVTDKGEKCVTKLAGAAKALKNDPKTVIAIDRPCLDLVGQAARYAGHYLVVTAQTTPGGWYQSIVWWAFGWLVPSQGAQPVSLIVPLCLMMGGVVAVLVGLGLGVERKPLGALISPENRYSLALAQVTFWTILVLTSVVVIAIFNGGLVAEQLRYYAHLQDSPTLPDAVSKGFFPTVPDAIWSVLGITFASPALSALLKSFRRSPQEGMPEFSVRGADADAANQAGKGVIGFRTPLDKRPDTRKASIADWFLGEDVNTAERIDITRLQMVILTVGLLVAYGETIFAALRDLPAQDILLAIRDTSVLVPSLPAVGATMAVILAVSHATYLIAKATESKPAGDVKPPKDGE